MQAILLHCYQTILIFVLILIHIRITKAVERRSHLILRAFVSMSFFIYGAGILCFVFGNRTNVYGGIEFNVFRGLRSCVGLIVEIYRSFISFVDTGIWYGISNCDYNLAILNESVSNILLFIPLGYLFPSLFGIKRRGLSRIVWLGLSLSLSIELIQWITRLGRFDIDDLINNTLGAVAGYILYSKAYTSNQDRRDLMLKRWIKSFLQTNYGTVIYNRLNPKNNLRINRENRLICDGMLSSVDIQIRGKNNKIEIERGCRLNNCTIKIFGNNNSIRIGKNCQINNGRFWVEDDNGTIFIQQNTTVNGNTEFASIEGKNITVGEDCMFSSNITLRTGDSHSILDMQDKRINPSADITIGGHVWLSEGVTILKGVNLPNNTIVGTKALVTKSFSDEFTAIAGVPAKVVKRAVKWDRQRISI